MSILFALLGVVIAGFMALLAFWSYFAGRAVHGWASTACLISFFASLQLICLGVIGEYVGRTYIEVKDRPLFIVNKVWQHKE